MWSWWEFTFNVEKPRAFHFFAHLHADPVKLFPLLGVTPLCLPWYPQAQCLAPGGAVTAAAKLCIVQDLQGSGSQPFWHRGSPWLGFSESWWLWALLCRAAVLLTPGAIPCTATRGCCALRVQQEWCPLELFKVKVAAVISPNICFKLPLLFGQWVCFLHTEECVEGRPLLSWLSWPLR